MFLTEFNLIRFTLLLKISNGFIRLHLKLFKPDAFLDYLLHLSFNLKKLIS